MDLRTLLYLIAALVVIEVVPGPSVIAVAIASLQDRRLGLWTALGVATGDVLWAAAALGGIGTVLEQSRPTSVMLHWLGACYLAVLAIRFWRQHLPTAPTEDTARPHVRWRRSFLNGLLVDLANPKAALFFTSLYASVLPRGLDTWAATAVLVTTSVVVYGWHLLVVAVLSGSGSGPRRWPTRSASRAVNRVAATVMGALGIRSALSG
jgi:threonine efflux protein